MSNGSTTFHRIRDIHFGKVSYHGTSWVDITITDRDGISHVVNCFPANEPLSITFGPDKVVIDDKLASG